MPTYNSLISRTDAAALNTEEVSNALLEDVANTSAALQLFRRIPVAQSQVRFPVLSALPTAYFVTGDTGLKQTTEMAWANKYMNIEEIAAIVPVPDAVLEDAQFDVFGAVRPLVADAIARTLDAAVFFGTNKPASWPNSVVTDATTASNTVTRGTANQASGGIATDISNLFGTVESDGFNVSGMISDVGYRARFRNARDTTGQALYDFANNQIYGSQLRFSMPGLWPTGSGSVELIAGDFSKGILGVRRDITIDPSNEAVVQDNTGTIVYNAYQQDLTLLRVTFRVGFVVSNPLNRFQTTEASRYPFALMLAP